MSLKLLAIVPALAIAIMSSGCSTPAASEQSGMPGIEQRIASAHTRADHEAIAAYYDQQAATARASADKHRRLAAAYTAQPPGGRGGGGMASHCRQLATTYEGAAATYEQMAGEHRQMAASMSD